MWQDQALCRNYPNVVFFPEVIDDDAEEGRHMDDGTIWERFGDTSDLYEEARSVCMRCPVRQACLDTAIDQKERWGMWGGLTPIERRRIERKDRRDRLKERRASE